MHRSFNVSLASCRWLALSGYLTAIYDVDNHNGETDLTITIKDPELAPAHPIPFINLTDFGKKNNNWKREREVKCYIASLRPYHTKKKENENENENPATQPQRLRKPKKET